jgi:hypothetical protein
MNQLPTHIPKEVHLEFLGRTIEIHWDYHAILMVLIWFVMVPICILAIRFGKPRPRPKGIREEIRITNLVWWWFSTHKLGLYIAMGLSLLGGAIALTVSKGFSGSAHAVFGILTIALGLLQVVSSWLRGKHGGKYYFTADVNDPKTWFGDHYNMTPRRRWFEAFHKNAGYLGGFCAVGAVASGLMQYPMPMLLGFMVFVVIVVLGLSILLEYKGLRYDGYRAAFGNDPEHPYNIARRDL